MHSPEVPPLQWVAQSRLRVPRLRDDLVARPALLDTLHRAVTSHAVSLVLAPTGFGKTTLLASLFHLYPELTAVWLSIDPEDNDPILFLSAVVAALQRLDPACGMSVQALVAGQGAVELNPRRLFALLVNEIESSLGQPFVLVLDDLHLITNPAVLEGIDFLLEHLPERARVIGAARAEPGLALTRLRSRGTLAEMRLSEMRFSLDETRLLLNERLRLSLTEAETLAFYSATEGWVAGLRLVAATVGQQHGERRSEQIERLTRSNRHVFDLLAEEVLNREPATIRLFLLKSSILEELTAERCIAVTGDPTAGETLDEVYRRNLFLVAVDDDASVDGSFRYHSLFREFLRHRLARELPGEIPSLHRRAAEATPVLSARVQHYLAAEAWEAAAIEIGQAAEQLFNQGWVERLQTWIDALPEATRREHPRLDFFMGVTMWALSQHQSAIEHLEAALDGFTRFGDDGGRGETLVQLAILYQTMGDFRPAEKFTAAAEGLPLSPRSQAQWFMSQAWLSMARGALDAAQEKLDGALFVAEQSGDAGALQICVLQTRAVFQCLPRGVESHRRLEELIEARHPAEKSPLEAGLWGLRAYLNLLACRLPEALEAAERARQLSERLGRLPWLMVDVGILLPQLHALAGDIPLSEERYREQEPYMALFEGWKAGFLYQRAHSYWLQGRRQEAREVYERLQTDGAGREWPIRPLLLRMMGALLALDEARYDEAERLLREAILMQAEVALSTIFGSARLQLAILLERRGDAPAALRELRSVLSDYAPSRLGLLLLEGAPLVPVLRQAVERGIAVDRVAPVLQALEWGTGARALNVPATGETLTAREVEVLRMVVEGATNQAIADRLVIALPTVKTHVARILGKLQARTRAEAAAKAREWNLVPR